MKIARIKNPIKIPFLQIAWYCVDFKLSIIKINCNLIHVYLVVAHLIYIRNVSNSIDTRQYIISFPRASDKSSEAESSYTYKLKMSRGSSTFFHSHHMSYRLLALNDSNKKSGGYNQRETLARHASLSLVYLN